MAYGKYIGTNNTFRSCLFTFFIKLFQGLEICVLDVIVKKNGTTGFSLQMLSVGTEV